MKQHALQRTESHVPPGHMPELPLLLCQMCPATGVRLQLDLVSQLPICPKDAAAPLCSKRDGGSQKQMAMKCGLSSACLNVLVLLVDGRSSAAVIDLAAFAGTCDFPACESPGSSGRDAVRNSTDAMQGQRKLRWAKEETRHNFANMQITCQGARPEGSWRCHT